VLFAYRCDSLKESDDFEIKILKLHWIKDDGIDDPEDFCIHGEALVRINNEILSN